eukprot:maker-scaffold278_size225338-snap-gene-1.26 protein:Tk03818 transcript:maker-scaffold278_size225338-snap-gene-1.26-mRNA-1 annotation:"-trans-enoyl- mitochondrial"
MPLALSSVLRKSIPRLLSRPWRVHAIRSVSSVVRETELESGFVTLSLNHPPVNSFNLEFTQDILATFADLSNSPSCKGVILTSAHNSVVSAGLDLSELYQPDPERLRTFWISIQDLWFNLYTFRLPLTIAINGHIPAGGMILSTCADYRVMVKGKFSMGLNEARFGLIAPFFLRDSFRASTGQRKAELALTTGTLYNPQEALELGLIDELAEDKEAALARCKVVLTEQFNKCVPDARYATKMSLRSEIVENFKKTKDSDLEFFIRTVTTPQVQKALGAYLASLKQK